MEFLQDIVYAAMITEVLYIIMPEGSFKGYIKVASGLSVSIMLINAIASIIK